MTLALTVYVDPSTSIPERVLALFQSPAFRAGAASTRMAEAERLRQLQEHAAADREERIAAAILSPDFDEVS